MRNSHLLLVPILACVIFSCKKDELANAKAQYAKLIIGNWKSNQQNIKVYDLATNELLKDSTVNFTGVFSGRSWYEIYTEDGNAYVTSLPTIKLGNKVATIDTTSYLHYTILGANLTLKQNIGGNTTKPILTLTVSDVGLQNTYVGTLNSGWGLALNTDYKIIEADYYTRQ
ncbi:MAG: hypothetical protein JWQ34_2323 [Mucilaginibacter sp.]|uniref:hypothetical protein n=1 Tax=Mucilaginibacter sp. TaxID=1882438 RepID=UPI002605A58C|nr:hypothetical protein [Mucilaginibacter sp.]MDB5004098.1 hypothetical protein [Mucilaginibacter sp.]